jgi:hypothetical protein
MTAAGSRRGATFWLVTAALLLVTLPYVFGFLYAVLMLPARSMICEGKFGTSDVIRDTISPVDVADYRYFLMGKGCHVPPPAEASTITCAAGDVQCATNAILNASLGGIESGYRGTHQFFGDDIVSRLFSYMGDAYPRAATAGTMLAIELHNTNTIFQALTLLFFAVLAIAFPIVVTRLAQWAADRIVPKSARERESN